MKKFDVALKMVEGSTDPYKIIKAKKILEALSEEQLSEEISEKRAMRLVSFKSIDSLIDQLADGENPEKDILPMKVAKAPKNYDAALSLAIRNDFEQAHDMMDSLIQKGELKDEMA